MKLQHKLLALAVMGLAAAAPAQAKIANATSGNGELFLSVWHDNGTAVTSDDVSYSRDLGTLLNTWAGAAAPFALNAARTTAGYVESYLADTKLANFLGSMGVGAVLKWNVVGGDVSGADRVLTTVNGAVVVPSLGNLAAIGTAIDTHLAAVNPLADTQNGFLVASVNADNLSNTATASNGNAYSAGVIWGANLGGNTAFNTTAGLGQELDFYMLYGAGNAAVSTSVSKFTDALNPASAAKWQLASNGTLTYSIANVAAIPEADTWAMFAAGLLAVGAIARRRMAA
ncbi:MAG: hypothetical protein IV108_05035 [Burkholderiales bacterium]|nr:hypothetical protein [Burkholderiales bacterium]